VQLAPGRGGAIYFVGLTGSTNLPVTANAQQPNHQSPEEFYWGGFFGILEPDGSALRYLSYFGRGLFTRVHDLAISTEGAVLITGRVAPSEPPAGDTRNVFQRNFGGGSGDAFVARLSPADWSTEWFSYLGGSGEESANGLVLDADESIYVTGTAGCAEHLSHSVERFGGHAIAGNPRPGETGAGHARRQQCAGACPTTPGGQQDSCGRDLRGQSSGCGKRTLAWIPSPARQTFSHEIHERFAPLPRCTQ
jgi:hypothetical protein